MIRTVYPVRPRKGGKYVHASFNLRFTLCGRRCFAWACSDVEWSKVGDGKRCPHCWELTAN